MSVSIKAARERSSSLAIAIKTKVAVSSGYLVMFFIFSLPNRNAPVMFLVDCCRECNRRRGVLGVVNRVLRWLLPPLIHRLENTA